MTMTDYRKRAEECIEIAQTARTPAQRRERVDAAATQLVDVGNIFDLAYLLTSAAYTALGD